MSYDFTAASDFLQNEIETTPEELYDEIVIAMKTLGTIRNKRNRKLAQSVYDTLLTCADLMARISPQENKQAS